MAILSIPTLNKTIRDPKEIKAFFEQRNLFFDQWTCDVIFDDSVTQEEILAAYSKDLQPFMETGGYKTADVISINQLTENYDIIRAKFLSEHTHSEDEIRFFVDGQGLFWFHLENEPVFNLLCEKGDLISVPAGTKHWFDAGAVNPFVKAIRIFIDMSGWIPEYTSSSLEKEFADFQVPLSQPIKYILTDIEGTTSSVTFVYDKLFPYFRNNIHRLKAMSILPEVQEAFSETIRLTKEESSETLSSVDEVIAKLEQWSLEDRKTTPLKTLQGILWKEGYEKGELKGHVYADVKPFLEEGQQEGLEFGVFSSGSVQAQQLIFGFSIDGDLTPYFTHYFDITTGGKREHSTYKKIADTLKLSASDVLFLSDIVEELKAANQAGMQTIQLVRENNSARWNRYVSDFSKLKKMIQN